MEPTRRDFLHTGASGVGAAWLASVLPAITSAACQAAESIADGGPFRALTETEATELEAVAARIIPGDEHDPGAREANVIRFMDAAFATFLAGELAGAREGLASLQARVAQVYPDRGPFSRLLGVEQDALLEEIEAEPFFGLVRLLTVAGMFSLPELGGNRDEAGWRMIGFEHRGAWAPPFGSYDAEAHGA